ncbi:hypothetical protein TREES_T100000172 [Tupaia chinensis]|uniref:Uncharacterized protein n=1 Tax=Tupaia chinensis TaxID=246437 RepID=L9LC48_TUPCH|nr:hypothetical protein TREES_T100000172 [Tupaia chinensis]
MSLINLINATEKSCSHQVFDLKSRVSACTGTFQNALKGSGASRMKEELGEVSFTHCLPLSGASPEHSDVVTKALCGSHALY